jgi:hypothetical protein
MFQINSFWGREYSYVMYMFFLCSFYNKIMMNKQKMGSLIKKYD